MKVHRVGVNPFAKHWLEMPGGHTRRAKMEYITLNGYAKQQTLKFKTCQTLVICQENIFKNKK